MVVFGRFTTHVALTQAIIRSVRTTAVFFVWSILSAQDEMQLLVASAGDEADAARLAAEAPRWFNTSAAPWARLAAVYVSAEVTPPAFAFQARRGRQ